MPATGEIGERLDRIEEALRSLQAELDEIRAWAGADAAAPVTELVAPAAPPGTVTPAVTTTAASAAAAWRALERGRERDAVELAEAALAQAADAGDADERRALVAFAETASGLVLDPELAVRLARLAGRAPERAAAQADERTGPAAPVAPPLPPVAAPPPRRVPAATAPSPGPARPGRVAEWARRELTGSRLFVLGGGALMLLGIVFLFVVAANRGWIGPGDRVVLGAVASGAVLAAGLVLRRRYGRLQASLAAVGVGIGGLYTTLAAATILYGLVPAGAALLLAAAIASVGGAVALAWSSQLLAGLALVGAAVAPGLVALDDGITAPAPAFALVVLSVAIAVAAPRRWLWLVTAVAATALPQVAWLVAEVPAEDEAALAVAAAASLVLLAGAIAWQATSDSDGADPASATMALLGAGVALGAARVLLPDARDAGLALAAATAIYGAAAIVAGRRYRDLGWVLAAAALVLAGVSTADLLSGRSLSLALAIQAVVLAGLARRLGSLRFELSALAYLAAGVVHVASVELQGAAEARDVPSAAVTALFALAAASLATGLLLPPRRSERASTGVLGVLEPLWQGLERERILIRALLTALALGLAAAGSAGILSGRWLTILWAGAAAALGGAAFAARESRLVAVALPALAFAATHAWTFEAPLSTLALERGLDPLAPIPSLLALGIAAAVLGLTCAFEQGGVRLLGSLEDLERHLAGLGGAAGAVLREALLVLALALGAWAAGLASVDRSYDWGQVAATATWAALGVALVARGARARAGTEIAGWGVVAFGFVKAVAFDWGELGATAASTSLLLVSVALLAAGFLGRWLDRIPDGIEVLALAAAAVATFAALVAVDRLADGDVRAFGAGALLVAAALAVVAAPPFVRWRRHREPAWSRTLATGYWALALATLLVAESALAEYGATRTLIAWGATATLLALAWRPAGEPRLWIAGLVVGASSALGVVAVVAPPDRLVVATAHPAEGFTALVACVVAAATLVATTPYRGELLAWLSAAAAVLGVYAVSLTVLELAERVSGASIETDFQRGHTALSTLLGLGALAVYVVGLARDHRGLRIAGLTLFGLALGKLFLYDLSTLSSITRALSFLALGAVLLAAGFFAERIVGGERGGGAGGAGPRAAAR